MTSSTRSRFFAREDGSVLPLVALLIIVLFGFTAIGVDISAAYAERRQAQSAADAGVLAGALMYLDPATATGDAVAQKVKDFVAQNAPGIPPTDADWIACTDPDKPAEYASIENAGGIAISDCISLKQVAGEPALLRVRMPNWDMPTSFAGVIGFDTVAVSATATAELRYQEEQKILPFSIPANADTEECMGTSPSGLLPGDFATAPCGGPAQGNFGLIESPWFGAGDPHFTDAERNCGNSGSQETVDTRSLHHLAYGLDHLITAWPTPPAPPAVGNQNGGNDPGADSCDSADNGIVPYIIATDTGNTNSPAGRAILEEGMMGNDPSITSGSLPGKLRQPSSPSSSGTRMDFVTSGWNRSLDNVGLWEYLTNTGTPADICDDTQFDNVGSNARTGRALTTQMIDCLRNGNRIFGLDILESPRFAVVPVLNYLGGETPGTKWWAVLELKPIYLQSSWYDCTNGSDNECLFLPDDFENPPPPAPPFDPTDRDQYSILFNPGEAAADQGPCYLDAGSCVTPLTSRFQMMGMSALVLEWDWIPGAENQLGGDAPFEVYLHTNE
ncbi:MAG: pilus assembly protein TadG-related protein [Actinomycetota bacterium]